MKARHWLGLVADVGKFTGAGASAEVVAVGESDTGVTEADVLDADVDFGPKSLPMKYV
jgi:hypothetical protein